MSDDLHSTAFLMGVAEDFLAHAKTIIGEHEPFVVRLASWTEGGVELAYILEPGGMLPNQVSRDAVIGLLARTYRVRSARAVDWIVPLPPGNFQDRLEERFRVYRRSGLEVGPGWYDLMTALGEWLEEVDPDREPFMQTKEKFGGLRAYGPVTDAGEPIVEAAEFLSRYICDMCGKPGTNAEIRGLWATRCDEHRDA